MDKLTADDCYSAVRMYVKKWKYLGVVDGVIIKIIFESAREQYPQSNHRNGSTLGFQRFVKIGQILHR